MGNLEAGIRNVFCLCLCFLWPKSSRAPAEEHETGSSCQHVSVGGSRREREKLFFGVSRACLESRHGWSSVTDLRAGWWRESPVHSSSRQ